MAKRFAATLPSMGITPAMSEALAHLSRTTGLPQSHLVRVGLTAWLGGLGLLIDATDPEPEAAGRRLFNKPTAKGEIE